MGGSHTLDTSAHQYQGMYAIQTDIDVHQNTTPNKGNITQIQSSKQQQAMISQLQSQVAYYRQQADQAMEQVKDMETNLGINKEIIKNLLEGATQAQVTEGTTLAKFQQAIKSLQGEYVN